MWGLPDAAGPWYGMAWHDMVRVVQTKKTTCICLLTPYLHLVLDRQQQPGSHWITPLALYAHQWQILPCCYVTVRFAMQLKVRHHTRSALKALWTTRTDQTSSRLLCSRVKICAAVFQFQAVQAQTNTLTRHICVFAHSQAVSAATLLS